MTRGEFWKWLDGFVDALDDEHLTVGQARALKQQYDKAKKFERVRADIQMQMYIMSSGIINEKFRRDLEA